MNDSLRTDLFVRYYPETIACACIFLAARQLAVPLPESPPWWEMFRVDQGSIHAISLHLLRLYARPKPNVTKLETKINELRKSSFDSKSGVLKNGSLFSTGPTNPVDLSAVVTSGGTPGSGSRMPTKQSRSSPDANLVTSSVSKRETSRVDRKRSLSKDRDRSGANGTKHRSTKSKEKRDRLRKKTSRVSRSRSRTRSPKAYRSSDIRSRSRSREKASKRDTYHHKVSSLTTKKTSHRHSHKKRRHASSSSVSSYSSSPDRSSPEVVKPSKSSTARNYRRRSRSPLPVLKKKKGESGVNGYSKSSDKDYRRRRSRSKERISKR